MRLTKGWGLSRRSCSLLFTIFLIVTMAASADRGIAQEGYDLIIRNGRVLDGSGNPWFRTDVALRGDRIAAVGDLKGAQAEKEIDASGLYVAPGFIDTHSHAAEGLSSQDRSEARPLIAEGVTTVVINPDGSGPVDLIRQRRNLLKDGLGINVAQLVSHGSIRQEVIGTADRLATPEELNQMRKLVRSGMKAGAFGLSSGPFYVPGCYSDTKELVELAQEASAYGGVYTSHIRDESDYTIGIVAAVDELVEIARKAEIPAVVTHIKALGPKVWGYSMAVIRRIQRARDEGVEVYASQYPYTASSTTLSAALLPEWAEVGGRDSLVTQLDHAETMAKIRAAVLENLDRRGGPDRIQFGRFEPDPTIQGKTLAEVAGQWGMDPIDASLKILRRGSPWIVSFNMDEQDVRAFMVQPWTMTCSDGFYWPWGQGLPHPRSFGTYPRKIRVYVKEKEILDLANAIRSMTSLPARVFHIQDRGVIQPGAYADLIVFDLDKLRDRATYTHPYQLAEGMVYVFVNGKPGIDKEQFTGSLNGKVLSRK